MDEAILNFCFVICRILFLCKNVEVPNGRLIEKYKAESKAIIFPIFNIIINYHSLSLLICFVSFEIFGFDYNIIISPSSVKLRHI